jgi:hypothetical protein
LKKKRKNPKNYFQKISFEFSFFLSTRPLFSPDIRVLGANDRRNQARQPIRINHYKFGKHGVLGEMDATSEIV